MVVGVDGADASLEALGWAAEEARLRGSSLRAIHAGAEPGVEVEKKIVEGDATDALVAERESVELVVVGSHGRTGLKAALLGSVSRHVVSHAACPGGHRQSPALTTAARTSRRARDRDR